MKSWLFPATVPAGSTRVVEATPEQVAATGAAGAAYSVDPLDGDRGWRPAGTGGHREVPWWTTEKARIYSVAAYRANPMARAIIDTYTSFCVGDSGVSYQATNPEVGVIVDQFWNDPRVQLGALQDLLLRDHMLMGETALQLLVGAQSGVVRFSPAPVSQISDVRLLGGNPLWPDQLVFGGGAGDGLALPVVAVNDLTGLREGKVMWWRSWRALLDDVHGEPFLMPILDHLDSYDQVISNLIDRTALARYMVWDVTVQGEQGDVDNFIKARGGVHVPPSGSVEVHNEKVAWKPQTASTGAEEDSIASKNVLTLVAGGAGLAKTWLAEPDGANRATSLTMAEPVRRRVGGVQKLWLSYQTELCRFVVDQAVRARRLPQMVTARDPRTGREYAIPAAQCVTVTGPSISASDAEFTAKILLNLSTGLEKLVKAGVLTEGAARIAARKAWEDYVGVPYTADLDAPDADAGDVATAVAESWGGDSLVDAQRSAERRRRGPGQRRTERHRAFDPDAHPRDQVGRFADKPDGPDDDPNWPGAGGGSTAAGPVEDRLKLAGRIDVPAGSRLLSSDRARGQQSTYTGEVLSALLATPAGPEVRLGVVDRGDVRRWRAGDLGGTARMDLAGVAALRAGLAAAADRTADRQAQWLALQREWDRAETRHDTLRKKTSRTAAEDDELRDLAARLGGELPTRGAQLGGPDDQVADGVVPGIGWGDIAYVTQGVDDDKGGWDVAIAIRPENAPTGWAVFPDAGDTVAVFEPAPLRRLLRHLDALAASAA